MDLSTEYNPAGDHDENEYDDLDEAEDVHEFDTSFRDKCMYARDSDDDRNCDPTFSPFGHVVIRCNQYILREDDTTGCCRELVILYLSLPFQ